MKSKLIMASAAAAAIAIVATGCGGDTKPLSKSAFLKQGNQICVERTKEREAAVTEFAKENPEAGPEEMVDEAALPPVKDMTDELNGLGVPKGDEKQVEAVITGLEEGIEEVEEDPKEALGSYPFEKANEAAAAYGLTECGI